PSGVKVWTRSPRVSTTDTLSCPVQVDAARVKDWLVSPPRECPLCQRLRIRTKLLDPVVATLRDVQIQVTVNCDACRLDNWLERRPPPGCLPVSCGRSRQCAQHLPRCGRPDDPA